VQINLNHGVNRLAACVEGGSLVRLYEGGKRKARGVEGSPSSSNIARSSGSVTYRASLTSLGLRSSVTSFVVKRIWSTGSCARGG
jgi:hypothetical protein